MKKALIVILLFACLVFFAQKAQTVSAEAQIKGGWMDSGESVAVETTSFLMVMSRTEVAADYGTGFLTLKNNSCEYLDYIKICVDNIEYNHITDKIRAYIRVYKRVPNIEMTRTFSGETMLVNDNSTVSVTLRNTGDVAARSVSFIDYFPAQVEVTDVDGATVSGSFISWKGKIDAGSSVDFTYKLKAKEEFDVTLKAEATYFDGFSTKTAYSDAKHIRATPFFEITPLLSRSEFTIGEKINLSINLTNREFYAVNIDYLDVSFDSDIQFIDGPFPLKKISENTYRWYGSISGAGSTNTTVNGSVSLVYRRYNLTSLQLKYVFRAVRSPSANIYIKAKYTDYYGVSRETAILKHSLTISNKGVKISSNFEDIALESFQKKQLIVWLQNLNTYAELRNVYANVSAFEYIPNSLYATMAPSEQKRIVDRFIYAPQVASSTGYMIKANVSYQTAFGENASYTYTTTFNVVPVKELLITKTLSSSTLESGETTTVTVTVQNQRKTRADNVAISEILPEGISASAYGVTSRITSINPESTITAYVYTITAPKVNAATTYQLETITVYTMKNTTSFSSEETIYSYSKNATLTVKPRQLLLAVQKQLDDSDVYSGEIVGVTYRISNPSTDQTAKNIQVIFPLQQAFDLLGTARSIYAGDLSPGETIYLTGKEKIRPKYNGSGIVIEKTRVEYTNQDGASFQENSTTTSLTVKGAYGRGPYIIAYKNAPAQANNTNIFAVNLTLSNIGSAEAVVEAADTTVNWTARIKPGENRTYSYAAKIKKPGKFELPQLVASYSYQNSTFLTGSNKPVIEIASSPMLSIIKTAPEQAKRREGFEVKIALANLLGLALDNLTVTDGERQWSFPSFLGEQTLNYTATLNQTGAAMLEKARATYWFDGVEYTQASGQPALVVVEEKAVALQKVASKDDVNQSEEFTLYIMLENRKDQQVDRINVTDGEKSWSITLGAGEKKTLSYKTSLADVKRYVLPAATARYIYKDEAQLGESNTLAIEVRKTDIIMQKKEPEKVPAGGIAKVLYYIKKILIWRR